MSDKPTAKPSSGKKVTLSKPKLIRSKVNVNDNPNLGGKPKPVASPADGFTRRPMPAKPKRSIENDNKRQEAKFNSRGAERPWKPKGRSKVVSKGSSDVKPRPVSKRTGSSDLGISRKTGYKRIG